MNGPHRVRIVNGMKVLMSVTSFKFNISNSLCLIALCYGYLDKRRLSPMDAARLAVGQSAETETGFETRFIDENIGKIICKH